MNAIRAIIIANLRRTLRDRANIFFMLILPLAIVFILGASIGGQVSGTLVGYHDGANSTTSEAIIVALDTNDRITIKRFDSVDDLEGAAARAGVDAAIAFAEDSSDSDGLAITQYPIVQASGVEAIEALQAAIVQVTADERVVDVVTEFTDAGDGAVADAIQQAEQAVAAPPVATEATGGGDGSQPSQVRTIIALGELTLFIFLTTIVGATYLLTSRQLGVVRRTRAGPVPVPAIIVGEAASRFLIALVQAGIIIGGSALLGVEFQRLDLIALLCVAMALVGTALSMVLGAFGRSEQQVSAIGVMSGLVLAALGGSMTPLEFFPDTMRKVAFVTPHAWMNDAMWQVVVDDGGFREILPALVVLTTAGVILLGVASWILARNLDAAN